MDEPDFLKFDFKMIFERGYNIATPKIFITGCTENFPFGSVLCNESVDENLIKITRYSFQW